MGDQIGKALAEKYFIPFYDKDAVCRLAKEKGLYEKYPYFYGEMPLDMMLYADTMAGDRNTPKAASEELPSRDWEAEIAEWQDKYLRLQAEFDNFRKRTLREKMELVQSGSAECVKNFLPLMDDLQRALEAIEKSNDLEALREGVKLIAQKFRETLKKQNVKEIEALGLELDTDHHEAVARFDAGKEKKGKIVDVVQPGYKMGDKVLRFAKVVVGE
jgi:molecular chaperone GrpE